MTPLELVTAAIGGLELDIHHYPTEIAVNLRGTHVSVGRLDGDTFCTRAGKAGLSDEYASRSDPGFRRTIRSLIAADAATVATNPWLDKKATDAAKTLVFRLLFPEEDAALRRETRCKPADSVGVVLRETQIGLKMCWSFLETQQAYVDAFPTLAAKVDYGDDIMRGLLPHLKANMRGVR